MLHNIICSISTVTVRVIIYRYTLLPAPPQRLLRQSSSISRVSLSFLTPLRLRVCSASATVTFCGWPLPYRHIQRLSSYSLQDKPEVLVQHTSLYYYRGVFLYESPSSHAINHDLVQHIIIRAESGPVVL
jgi:hypothetical protein